LIARLRLARPQRLGAAEVGAVLKAGRATRGARLVVYRLPNALAYARLALIVPKRFAEQAVIRNRIRRLAREAFRLQQARIGSSDCIVRLVRHPGEAPITRGEIETLLSASAVGNS
jgi:ribonuclease P protein component